MRHFLRPGRLALPIGGLAASVPMATPPALLIPPSGLPPCPTPGRLTAVPRAVALPAVAKGADVDRAVAQVAEESSAVWAQGHAMQVAWTPERKPDILDSPGAPDAQGRLRGTGVFADTRCPSRLSPSRFSPTFPGGLNFARARARRGCCLDQPHKRGLPPEDRGFRPPPTLPVALKVR